MRQVNKALEQDKKALEEALKEEKAALVQAKKALEEEKAARDGEEANLMTRIKALEAALVQASKAEEEKAARDREEANLMARIKALEEDKTALEKEKKALKARVDGLGRIHAKFQVFRNSEAANEVDPSEVIVEDPENPGKVFGEVICSACQVRVGEYVVACCKSVRMCWVCSPLNKDFKSKDRNSVKRCPQCQKDPKLHEMIVTVSRGKKIQLKIGC